MAELWGSLQLLFSFCNNKSENKKEPISKKPVSQERPVRGNDENIKLICFFAMSDFRNSKFKVKHVGERLISIDKTVLQRGDSISYDFNSSNQVVLEAVYTDEGKLKEKINFQINPSEQFEKISSKNFDGGSPMTLRYIYNKINQIIEKRDSGENFYTRFKYDAKNYLSQQQELSYKHNLLKITSYVYDNSGNLTSILTKSNSTDTISIVFFKYNELNQVIETESRGEPINCAGRNKWNIKYNELGDRIEEKTYDLTIHYKYEYDNKNNWIKRYNFYNEDKSPNFLTTRKIEYYN